ncbi:enamine deaminase RidA (YjgF/YER057c/UK114 family) [Yoonia maricola]|uniref:Enamine deaminase RidA (YjgF/YER057c/UK114 family) n=1 Tax=Yoonia maricola TaxID=420999 RepID=A0A2M8W5R8_9RHOB|nr:RidA family protein [Yoonia maricola]PJI86275.1 enamine deaminase RidA (YjgF/YER057c/UK114 family) [Yoonia maricola]
MKTVDIKRIVSTKEGRSDAVTFNGMAFLVAYDPDAAEGIEAQTRNCLRFLDAKLREVGSGKDALLQVTVFLSDMTMKSKMDVVWCDWIGASENWPQRACVGADLGDDVTLIEITAIAAQRESYQLCT